MQRSNTVRLVVVDDEPDIRGMITDYFARDGYDVTRCSCATELDLALRTGPADVVILDVALPGEDGLSIARRLRASGSTPIIMLTAMDGVVERVVGLEVGADDYVTKPFDLRELKARVRAVMRRAALAGPPEAAVEAPRTGNARLACFGKVCLDLERRVLIEEDGTETRLTATEFDLLSTFARNPNRILSRDRLLDCAPGRERDPFDRAIDIRVTRIRKKVEVDPAKPQVIRTVRSVGYIYVPPKVAA